MIDLFYLLHHECRAKGSGLTAAAEYALNIFLAFVDLAVRHQAIGQDACARSDQNSASNIGPETRMVERAVRITEHIGIARIINRSAARCQVGI
jgi:hypothetical protein